MSRNLYYSWLAVQNYPYVSPYLAYLYPFLCRRPPILQAELHVAGVRVVCDTTRLEFTQPVDYEGRPNGTVRLALLEVTLSGPAAFLPVWNEFKFNVFRRESGFVLWQTHAGQTVRRLTFFDASRITLVFARTRHRASHAYASRRPLSSCT